ncbi:hypothetical protein L1049_022787 [Liquidambar formosana]|uniref:Peptidase A1 domain-containing protein n=1 Tax=Liquidambar formosana TaxID=63359 RepID=A0AAP0RD01_LIQFO
MRRMPFSLLLIFLLFICIGYVSTLALSNDHSNTMRLELIHRHAPQLMGKVFGGRPKTQLQRIKELLHSDSIRQHMISHKRRLSLSQRRKAWETPRSNCSSSSSSSIEMAIGSGAYHGAGQYFVALKVGTPAQKFMVIADTGSDLTWMNCEYRCGQDCSKKKRLKHRRVFHADGSSSFRTVPCLSEMCKIELMNLFSLTSCPTPLTPCAYDYRYADGSAALGFFANETISLGLSNGRKTKLDDVLIGCSESVQGQSVQAADGVLGLGFSKYSFAFKAAAKFGGKFSYCLVDHLSPKNVSNYLTFGSHINTAASPNDMQFTKLLLGVISPLYAVNVMGISSGGVMLDIPFEVWDINGVGGTVFDSGTSLTYLTVPAYQPVMAALEASLLRFGKLKLDIKPLNYCFNSTGFDESLVPRLAFHFADGARFEPPVKSYVIDAAPGVKCVGFVSTSWPGTSVIGNIMQQNNLWEFDLVQNKLGFAPSTCT